MLQTERHANPELVPEQPALRLPDYRICIHVVLDADSPAELERSTGRFSKLRFRGSYVRSAHSLETPDPAAVIEGRGTDRDPELKSFEDDMFAYAYRAPPPFTTQRRGTVETITAHFPSAIIYESEGRRLLETENREGYTRDFRLVATRSYFAHSKRSVLHLALTPAGPAERSGLTEYDIIKLTKLWESGEVRSPYVYFSVRTEGGGYRWLGPSFQEAPPEHEVEPDTLDDYARRMVAALAEEVLDDGPTLATIRQNQRVVWFRVGTLDLLDPPASEQLFQDLLRLRSANRAKLSPLRAGATQSASTSNGEHARWRRVVAVGGIVQGLLDFAEIDLAELTDVFQPTVSSERGMPKVDQHGLVTIHKGTLVSLKEASDRDKGWPSAVNPYLAIPHGVILHNEERVRTALDYWRLAGSKRGPIHKARHHLIAMREALDQYVPDVFHYRSERDLYDEGHESRGISTLVGDARRELDLGENRVDYREKRRAAGLAITSLLLSVVATIESFLFRKAELLSGGVSVLLTLLGPILLLVAFWLWQRRST